jgi:hypothetical protein
MEGLQFQPQDPPGPGTHRLARLEPPAPGRPHPKCPPRRPESRYGHGPLGRVRLRWRATIVTVGCRADRHQSDYPAMAPRPADCLEATYAYLWVDPSCAPLSNPRGRRRGIHPHAWRHAQRDYGRIFPDPSRHRPLMMSRAALMSRHGPAVPKVQAAVQGCKAVQGHVPHMVFLGAHGACTSRARIELFCAPRPHMGQCAHTKTWAHKEVRCAHMGGTMCAYVLRCADPEGMCGSEGHVRIRGHVHERKSWGDREGMCATFRVLRCPKSTPRRRAAALPRARARNSFG